MSLGTVEAFISVLKQKPHNYIIIACTLIQPNLILIIMLADNITGSPASACRPAMSPLNKAMHAASINCERQRVAYSATCKYRERFAAALFCHVGVCSKLTQSLWGSLPPSPSSLRYVGGGLPLSPSRSYSIYRGQNKAAPPCHRQCLQAATLCPSRLIEAALPYLEVA